MRKYDSSKTIRVEHNMLQWGRNFIVAEITTYTVFLPPGYMLQWGRNFIVAEMLYVDPAPVTGERVLQWGRNFIVAEIRYSCP